MAKLLIVDDEPNLIYSLELGLASEKLKVIGANSGKRGIEMVQRESPDVVILDVRLPDMNGLEVFDAIRRIDSKLPVLLITAFATTELAIEAMKRGAFDYLLKPVDLHQLRTVVDKAIDLRRMQAVPAVFDQTTDAEHADRIIGQSPAMQAVYKAIGRIAPLDVNVLILGESGTGKELVARAIYQHSKRAKQPFLAVHCSAMAESLLESELFGHEKGSFPGADRKKIGKVEQGHTGTLFLDAMGDLTEGVQAKLLRLLQQKQFERIGGGETIDVDIRIIAATYRDLEDMVGKGHFRKDLFYRLNEFTIRLPPLRERREDIRPLVHHFLRLTNRKMDKQVVAVSEEAYGMLEGYSWPGNIRELQSAIRYAVVQTVGGTVTPEFLPPMLRGMSHSPSTSPVSASLEIHQLVQQLLDTGEDDIYHKVTQAVDRIVLDSVLQHVRGNQVQASELLGMSRTTLRAKLQSLGLVVEKQVRQDLH
jgi:two-component system nitrogen regulation response regulator GlnG